MGQCTSGELPIHSALLDKNGNPDMSETSTECDRSPVPSSTSSSRKYSRSRHKAAATWVSNRLSKRQKKLDLSATFNLFDHEMKGKLVNINLATEEELMTLAGINRQLAKNIVEYRMTIGGFKRTEDLVLVSGIGASVLQNIKNDVMIKKYCSLSRTQSVDSLPSIDSFRSQKSTQSANGCSVKSFPANGRSVKSFPAKAIDVNAASIFDLMTIRGMSQEMAANIVHYRSKKGGFRHLDEMVRVKGINSRILSLLRMYLTCNGGSPSSSAISDSTSVGSTSKPPIRPVRHRTPGHRRTHSAPPQPNEDLAQCTVDFTEPISPILTHRFSSDFSEDLFELLSLRSGRPHTFTSFKGLHQGQPAIRIGSWNLQQLTKDKVNNPGVLEVICRTILETGLSVIALQEIMSREVLEKICCELNCGSLRRIREWTGPRGEWKWQISDEPVGKNHSVVEYAAFIYNARHSVDLVTSSSLQIHNNNKYFGVPMRKPFLGYFKVSDLELVMVNLNLRTRMKERTKLIEEEVMDETGLTLTINGIGGSGDSSPSCKSESSRKSLDVTSLAPVTAALKEKLEAEKYVVLLGSFDMPPNDRAFDVLYESAHLPVFSPVTFTDISYDNPKGEQCVDNVWLSTHCQTLRTGSYGVVREGLSHMAIPRGWGWGGMVSDHCPIYCDLFTQIVNRPLSKFK